MSMHGGVASPNICLAHYPVACTCLSASFVPFSAHHSWRSATGLDFVCGSITIDVPERIKKRRLLLLME